MKNTDVYLFYFEYFSFLLDFIQFLILLLCTVFFSSFGCCSFVHFHHCAIKRYFSSCCSSSKESQKMLHWISLVLKHLNTRKWTWATGLLRSDGVQTTRAPPCYDYSSIHTPPRTPGSVTSVLSGRRGSQTPSVAEQMLVNSGSSEPQLTAPC